MHRPLRRESKTQGQRPCPARRLNPLGGATLWTAWTSVRLAPHPQQNKSRNSGHLMLCQNRTTQFAIDTSELFSFGPRSKAVTSNRSKHGLRPRPAALRPSALGQRATPRSRPPESSSAQLPKKIIAAIRESEDADGQRHPTGGVDHDRRTELPHQRAKLKRRAAINVRCHQWRRSSLGDQEFNSWAPSLGARALSSALEPVSMTARRQPSFRTSAYGKRRGTSFAKA